MVDRNQECEPFELVLGRLHEHGCSVRLIGDERARATCPTHRDKRPSLSITQVEGQVLLNCFAGCTAAAVTEALGLRLADLYVRGGTPTRRPVEIIAVYDYGAGSDGLRRQKVRTADKRFFWRTEDPRAAGGFRLGLGGELPGLYGADALVEDAEVVFLCEGEKAADHLRARGLIATCPPAGASTWKGEWAAALVAQRARTLVVLADHDRPGECHAERVAATTTAVPGVTTVVKVVRLPCLPSGGDVVDYLDGHTLDDLMDIVVRTPQWAPRQRRQELARARMQRLRARRRRDGQSCSAPRTDPINAALEAILAVLVSLQTPSFNAIWRALKTGTHSRRAVERALARGVEMGVLTLSRAEVRGRADAYGRGPRTLATLDPSIDIHSVTGPGYSSHVEIIPPAGGTPRPASSANETGLSHRSVTLFAVTRHVRTSGSLQESLQGRVLHENVTEERDTPEASEVLMSTGVCCGHHAGDEWRGKPHVLACRLCPKSPTYWRGAHGAR